MRAYSRDGALEEHGRVRFADKVHQRARDGHDDAGEIKGPAPVCLYVRHVIISPHVIVGISIKREKNIPV